MVHFPQSPHIYQNCIVRNREAKPNSSLI
ncbi:hypothetical protein YQE_02624, partial [Dendroctonus ponderosae]